MAQIAEKTLNYNWLPLSPLNVDSALPVYRFHFQRTDTNIFFPVINPLSNYDISSQGQFDIVLVALGALRSGTTGVYNFGSGYFDIPLQPGDGDIYQLTGLAAVVSNYTAIPLGKTLGVAEPGLYTVDSRVPFFPLALVGTSPCQDNVPSWNQGLSAHVFVEDLFGNDNEWGIVDYQYNNYLFAHDGHYGLHTLGDFRFIDSKFLVSEGVSRVFIEPAIGFLGDVNRVYLAVVECY